MCMVHVFINNLPCNHNFTSSPLHIQPKFWKCWDVLKNLNKIWIKRLSNHKANLKWTASKWKRVLWSDESKCYILVGNLGCSVLKKACPASSLSSAFSSKASIFDGMGVHKCIRYGQLACFGRHYECWKVYKDFRATYASPQTTCNSAGQCKTTYCSY